MIFKHKIIPNGARGLRKFMENFKDNSCELTHEVKKEPLDKQWS